MKSKVREKDTSQVTDDLQDQLEHLLSEAAQQFFEHPDVKKHKLKGYKPQDILSGTLLTLFIKHVAYLAAQEDGNFDHETYLQGVFESMSHLFAKCRENFVEVLKDKDENNSNSH